LPELLQLHDLQSFTEQIRTLQKKELGSAGVSPAVAGASRPRTAEDGKSGAF
jgi:hypothetical protein